MIRVLLVDDEELVCAHLRTMLGAADDIEVVGACHDGAVAVADAARLAPDVVLMDLRMPGVDGVSATRQIAATADPPRVVALTTFVDDAAVHAVLAAGAAGFVLKSTAPADLLTMVRAAAAGHTVLAPAARDVVMARQPTEAPTTALRRATEQLTPREHDVLEALGRGRTNAEIAAALGLSEATVKGHVSRLLAKTGCSNRTQAGLLAQRVRRHVDDG